MTNNENPELKPQTPDATGEMKKEDPFAVGRERMAKAGQFIDNVKTKTSSFFSRIGGGISKFWNRTKNFGGEAVAATLSADVLAKKGYNKAENFIDEKGHQIIDATAKGVNQAGEWIGEKSEKIADAVTAGYDKTVDFTGKKIDQAGNWVEAKSDQFSEFAKNKAEQVKDITKSGIELGKDAAFYAKQKTAEGLVAVKNGVANQYGRLETFSKNAIEAGKMKAAQIKDNWRAKMNAVREARLQAQVKAQYDQAVQRENAALAQAKQILDQAAFATKAREELAQKLSLMQGLKVAV